MHRALLPPATVACTDACEELICQATHTQSTKPCADRRMVTTGLIAELSDFLPAGAVVFVQVPLQPSPTLQFDPAHATASAPTL